MDALPSMFSLTRGWRQFNLETAIASVEWEQPTIRIYGRTHNVPRLVAWFGTDAYSYSGVRHRAAAMPEWVAAAKGEIEALTGATFNSVLLNYYRDGRDSVAWHADDEPELGTEPTIASWTIGASRTFAVKARNAEGPRWNVPLGDGDLLIMSGRSQLDYLHSVPKTTRPIGPRLNLTFRKVR